MQEHQGQPEPPPRRAPSSRPASTRTAAPSPRCSCRTARSTRATSSSRAQPSAACVSMTDDKGRAIQSAGPSIPVEITGLAETPTPGDEFDAVADERMARQLVEQRKQAEKDVRRKAGQQGHARQPLCQNAGGRDEGAEPSSIKADVQGSAEAVRASLEKLSNEEVRVRVIHAGVRRDQRVRYPAGLHGQRPSSSASTSVRTPPRRPRPSAPMSISACTASSTTPSTRSKPP